MNIATSSSLVEGDVTYGGGHVKPSYRSGWIQGCHVVVICFLRKVDGLYPLESVHVRFLSKTFINTNVPIFRQRIAIQTEKTWETKEINLSVHFLHSCFELT